MSILAGQSAIVTGAGRGFGRAIALALAGEKAQVTLISRSGSEIEFVEKTIVAADGHANAIVSDVRDFEAAAQAYDVHRRRYGRPTILVNCAGAGEPCGPVGVVSPQEWWQSVAVHVLGAMNYMSLAIPDMRGAGRGCIINVASIAAHHVIPNNSTYGVAKAALVRLSEHVAKETADAGVAVFPVHPGVAITALAENVIRSPEAKRWMPGFVALLEGVKARGGSAEALERCGRCCVALASGKHDRLTGQFINFEEFSP